MEGVVVEIVASLVIVGEFERWFDVVGNFWKELWWFQECCRVWVWTPLAKV